MDHPDAYNAPGGNELKRTPPDAGGPTGGAGWPPARDLGLVVLLAVALYANSVANSFVFDDRLLIERNRLLVDGAPIGEVLLSPYHAGVDMGTTGLYRPLVVLSFAVNHLAGGLEPFGYHVVNILLHAGVSALVLLLAWWLGAGRIAAVASALIFAAHPVHTEAVANLAGRAELMSAFFFLIALVVHIRARGLERPRDRALMVIAAIALLLALLSKENALTFVGVAVVYDLLFPGRPGVRVRERLAVACRKLLFVVPAVVLYLGVRGLALGGIGGPSEIPFLDNPVAEAGVVVRSMTATVVAARYLALLVFPLRLSPDYSYAQIPPVESATHTVFLAAALVLVAVTALAARWARRTPTAAFAMLFTVVTFSITSNFLVPIGTIMAERLLYLPSVGFCVVAGLAVAAARVRLARTGRVVLLMVLVLGSVRTVSRNAEWRDGLTLFTAAARTSPSSARVHNNLGSALMRQGETEGACDAFREAITIYDGYEGARLNLGQCLLVAGDAAGAERELRAVLAASGPSPRALLLLGQTLARQERFDEAERTLLEGIELAPAEPALRAALGSVYRGRGDVQGAELALREALQREPSSATIHNDLALLLKSTGRLDDALIHFRKAVELDPGSVRLRNNLADALREAGDTAGAIAELERALSIDPTFAATHFNMGVAHEQSGRDAEASERYRRTLALDPEHPRADRGLGRIALRAGSPDAAIEHLDRAVVLAPSDPESLALRARALLAVGRVADAEADYLELLRLRPESVEANVNLGVIHARRGEIDRARRYLEEALRLAPDSPRIRANLEALEDASR